MKTNKPIDYVGDGIVKVTNYLLSGDYTKATQFISPKEIIRGVRTTHNGKINNRDNIEITLTIGKPNFLEREFIKQCQKSGEPFPVNKVQLKLYNPKKKKLKGK